jgi:predicted GNAT family acetyltransferase
MLSEERRVTEFELSYHQVNVVAASAYAKLGFVPTGELEADERVAGY